MQSIATREQFLRDEFDRFVADTAEFDSEESVKKIMISAYANGEFAMFPVRTMNAVMQFNANISVGSSIRSKYYDVDLIADELFVAVRTYVEMARIPEDMLANPKKFGKDAWEFVNQKFPQKLWFGARYNGLAEAIGFDLTPARRMCVFTEKIAYVQVHCVADAGVTRYLPAAALQQKER